MFYFLVTMRTHRKVILAIAVLLVPGTVSASLGYALYLRSDAFRRGVERDLSVYLDLPAEIGRVRPLSSSSRRFDEIKVWLPGRSSQVFECRRAIWRNLPDSGAATSALELDDGWFLLGTGQFRSDDYRKMLKSGLGHDFRQLGLSSVHLANMDVRWQQPDFGMQVTGASGDVLLATDGSGAASLSARRLNGVDVDEPINIDADFTPGAALEVHRVQLHVPRIALAGLGLDGVLGSDVTHGWFEGSVNYRADEGAPSLRLRGSLDDARLEELTQRLPGGSLSGGVDIRLDEALVIGHELRSLLFSGRLSDIRLREFGTLFEAPDLDGRIDLRVHQAQYQSGVLTHLSADGTAEDVSLAAVTRLIGKGVITGDLKATFDSLIVVDGKIRWADIRLDAVPPKNRSGLIDREMILYAARELVGVDLGSMADYFPDAVEYARLGCRLVVDRDVLRVRGSHGDGNRTILSINLLGREIGVLKEPDREFAMADVLDKLRQKLSAYDVERFLHWWEAKRSGSSKR